MTAQGRTTEQRVTDYLSGGGLFNPELANHDAVRDLLIDCRAENARLRDALLCAAGALHLVHAYGAAEQARAALAQVPK